CRLGWSEQPCPLPPIVNDEIGPFRLDNLNGKIREGGRKGCPGRGPWSQEYCSTEILRPHPPPSEHEAVCKHDQTWQQSIILRKDIGLIGTEQLGFHLS